MPKNMWTRIFIFCGLGLLVSLFPPPAGAQPPTDGCTPDSLLFLGNDRLWRPGEPLEWASASTWAELDSLNPDGFWLIVESPRKPGYLRIRKISAPEGHHAVYTDGDLRFISYNDGPNRSQSTLVGHNYDATPYWFNSVCIGKMERPIGSSTSSGSSIHLAPRKLKFSLPLKPQTMPKTPWWP